MASSQPATMTVIGDVVPEEDQVWDEERFEKALKTLKEMHIQIRDLRTTLPRLIAPISKKQDSPKALFSEFTASAKKTSQEVHEFRVLLEDKNTIEIMDRAKKSRAENPEGIKPWKVRDHPDWLVREK